MYKASSLFSSVFSTGNRYGRHPQNGKPNTTHPSPGSKESPDRTQNLREAKVFSNWRLDFLVQPDQSSVREPTFGRQNTEPGITFFNVTLSEDDEASDIVSQSSQSTVRIVPSKHVDTQAAALHWFRKNKSNEAAKSSCLVVDQARETNEAQRQQVQAILAEKNADEFQKNCDQFKTLLRKTIEQLSLTSSPEELYVATQAFFDSISKLPNPSRNANEGNWEKYGKPVCLGFDQYVEDLIRLASPASPTHGTRKLTATRFHPACANQSLSSLPSLRESESGSHRLTSHFSQNSAKESILVFDANEEEEEANVLPDADDTLPYAIGSVHSSTVKAPSLHAHAARERWLRRSIDAARRHAAAEKYASAPGEPDAMMEIGTEASLPSAGIHGQITNRLRTRLS